MREVGQRVPYLLRWGSEFGVRLDDDGPGTNREALQDVEFGSPTIHPEDVTLGQFVGVDRRRFPTVALETHCARDDRVAGGHDVVHSVQLGRLPDVNSVCFRSLEDGHCSRVAGPVRGYDGRHAPITADDYHLVSRFDVLSNGGDEGRFVSVGM